MSPKNKSQIFRFIVIGIINTIIDFGVLFTLNQIGIPTVSANIISTSCAFCFSYIANRSFTFKARTTNLKREISLFIAVTFFGLWVIQGLIIFIVFDLLKDSGLPNSIVLLTAKVIATGASLTWNYILYSRVVFKNTSDDSRPRDE